MKKLYVKDSKGKRLYVTEIVGNEVKLSASREPPTSPLDGFDIEFTLTPKREVEDQSRNGVRVIVTRTKDGSHVDASCSCFGFDGRAHNHESCPNRLRQVQRFAYKKDA